MLWRTCAVRGSLVCGSWGRGSLVLASRFAVRWGAARWLLVPGGAVTKKIKNQEIHRTFVGKKSQIFEFLSNPGAKRW